MSSDEAELIACASSGDKDAFCQLVKRYERSIYSLALCYCGEPSWAEDLSQEVWLKAYRALASFKGESSFYAWLRRIMINTFLNQKRAKTIGSNNEVAIDDEQLESVTAKYNRFAQGLSLAEELLHTKILAGRVSKALAEITPRQRMIFLLKYQEGMTYAEISEMLNCSIGTIKKSLFRAVSKLRQQLGVTVESTKFARLVKKY